MRADDGAADGAGRALARRRAGAHIGGWRQSPCQPLVPRPRTRPVSAPTGLAPRPRRTRIGRIVTDAPTSTRLMLASGYFLLGGAVTLLAALVAVVDVLRGGAMLATPDGAAPSLVMRSIGVAWIALLGGLYLWTGLLLGRGEWRGSYLAAGILGVSFVLNALDGSVSVGNLVFTLLGFAVLWSIRDELD